MPIRCDGCDQRSPRSRNQKHNMWEVFWNDETQCPMRKDLADFEGVLKVKVVRIQGFPVKAGSMETTHSSVELELGEEKQHTTRKKNADSITVYDEEFAFNKQEGESTLKVKVWGSDTLPNDLLGQRDVDLDDESIAIGSVDVVFPGKVTGQVVLELSYG